MMMARALRVSPARICGWRRAEKQLCGWRQRRPNAGSTAFERCRSEMPTCVSLVPAPRTRRVPCPRLPHIVGPHPHELRRPFKLARRTSVRAVWSARSIVTCIGACLLVLLCSSPLLRKIQHGRCGGSADLDVCACVCVCARPSDHSQTECSDRARASTPCPREAASRGHRNHCAARRARARVEHRARLALPRLAGPRGSLKARLEPGGAPAHGANESWFSARGERVSERAPLRPRVSSCVAARDGLGWVRMGGTGGKVEGGGSPKGEVQPPSPSHFRSSRHSIGAQQPGSVWSSRSAS